MTDIPEEIRELITAASGTLSEQRKEFARGELADLDRLEDAIEAVQSLYGMAEAEA